MKFDDCQPLMGSGHIDNNWQMPFLTLPEEVYFAVRAIMITPFLTSCCSTGSQDFDQTTFRCIIKHLLLTASVTITWPFFSKSHIYNMCF